LRIEGVRVVEMPSGDTNNGTFTALAKPFADILAFEDEKSYGQCRVRMQRIGAAVGRGQRRLRRRRRQLPWVLPPEEVVRPRRRPNQD
jgi:hypothetical protein